MYYSNKIIEEVKNYKKVVEQVLDFYTEKSKLTEKISHYDCMDTVQELENKIKRASTTVNGSIDKYEYQYLIYIDLVNRLMLTKKW